LFANTEVNYLLSPIPFSVRSGGADKTDH
jgi:hypothetical protein